MEDVIVVGSGMGGLSAATLLAQKGYRVKVLERNYLPGGCSSSYWRKGFVWESGATTLFGLEPGFPPGWLFQKLGLRLPARRLDLPMQVRLPDGQVLNRYYEPEKFAEEAGRVFGQPRQQARFWRQAKAISDWVWEASLRYRPFPPQSPADLLALLKRFRPADLRRATGLLRSTEAWMKSLGLAENSLFRQFIDEQLLITAQNFAPEVNQLFGAASLSYTFYPNYYLDGGLINLVRPLCDYLQQKGGQLQLRHQVEGISHDGEQFTVWGLHKRQPFELKSRNLVWAAPVNNLQALKTEGFQIKPRQLLGNEELVSAFQLGIGIEGECPFSALHQQLLLPEPLPEIGSTSLFLSYSHPQDHSRSDKPGQSAVSLSTHLFKPDPSKPLNKEKLTKTLLEILEARQLISREKVVYTHASQASAWDKWLGRAWGAVGGYPQSMKRQPWQLNGAALGPKGLYLAGDTAYPGQGIPGATLTGILAAEKLVKRNSL